MGRYSTRIAIHLAVLTRRYDATRWSSAFGEIQNVTGQLRYLPTSVLGNTQYKCSVYPLY
eukprot:3277119-Rhodomonas_salina.1